MGEGQSPEFNIHYLPLSFRAHCYLERIYWKVNSWLVSLPPPELHLLSAFLQGLFCKNIISHNSSTLPLSYICQWAIVLFKDSLLREDLKSETGLKLVILLLYPP